MVLVIHIFVALASVVSGTYAFAVPSRAKINATYGLTLGTIASGTYLVLSTHSPLLPSCVTGLLFVGTSLSSVFLAQRKLARQEVRIKRQ